MTYHKTTISKSASVATPLQH